MAQGEWTRVFVNVGQGQVIKFEGLVEVESCVGALRDKLTICDHQGHMVDIYTDAILVREHLPARGPGRPSAPSDPRTSV